MNLDTLFQETGVIAEGYEDPPPEGQNVSFSCPPEMVLTGPNTTTCMEDGEWEPDPNSLTCESFEGAVNVTMIIIPQA